MPACNAPPYVITNATLAAKAGGFSGVALNTIVAIAMSESCLNNNATHSNSDGSIDRGVLQINNKAHPEVSDSCAFQESCAFKAAFTISKQGTNFNPWTTYTSGDYKSNLQTVEGITGIQGDLGGASGNVNDTSSIIPGIGTLFSNLTSNAFWKRLILGAVGAIAMFAGIALLIDAFSGSKPVRSSLKATLLKGVL